MSREVYMDGGDVVTVTREPIHAEADKTWDVMTKETIDFLLSYWQSDLRAQWRGVDPHTRVALFLMLLDERANPWKVFAKFELNINQESSAGDEHKEASRQYGTAYATNFDFYDTESVWSNLCCLLFELAVQADRERHDGECSIHFEVDWVNTVVAFSEDACGEIWDYLAPDGSALADALESALGSSCNCCGEMLSEYALKCQTINSMGGVMFREFVEWLDSGGNEKIIALDNDVFIED